MGLTLTLLGAPTIQVDGSPLQVDTRKASALLCLLAVREDRMTRDAVADTLWPTASPDRARASLRRTLSALTSGLDGRWVQADRTSIWIVLDDTVRCDVHVLRRAVARLRSHHREHDPAAGCPSCVAAVEQAADVVAGTFLDGFSLRDAPAFDDWVTAEAEALRRDASVVLERLVELQEEAGHHDEALVAARRWLALDHLHEQAHCAVIRIAMRAGRRDEAIRQYRECVAVLDRELGVAPLPETTALYSAVLEERQAPPATPAATTPNPPLVDAAAHGLVDRDEELERLRRTHDGLVAGARCVVLEGEAGIGKTRVANEFVDYAAARGARTLVVRCRQAESGLTCGPVIDLLRDALRADPSWAGRLSTTSRAEVARIVPEVAATTAPVAPLDSPGAQVRFLDGLVEALATAVAGTPAGVVLVDDLHWADPTSLDVLAHTLRRHSAAPLLVVATWRSELVSHDDPLRRALRDTATDVVALPRLTRGQVAELVGEVRPTMLGLVDRLFEETEGIPFFVVEYLAATDEEAWELPTSVLDLLATRLEPLGELARQCLTAAAILGRSFDLALLERTSGRSEDEVVVAVEELVARRLIREHEAAAATPMYDFTHTKLREVAYQGASLARRRLLHRRAAEAIVAAGPSSDVASRAAHHYALAGREAEAAEHHLLAGVHARSLFANREALEHLEAALALGHPDHARLHRDIGDLHALSGRYGEAATSYASAAAYSADEGMLAELEHRLGRLAMRRGDWELAARQLDRSLEQLDLGGDTCLRPRVRADRAVVWLRLGDVDAAEREVDVALAEADACQDPAAITAAHNTAGLVERRRGRPDRAREHLELALAGTDGLDDPSPRVASLNNLALALADTGDLGDALAAALEALELSGAVGDVHHQAALHSNVADLLHQSGRTDQAMPHLTESARLLATIGEPATPEPEIWKLTDW